MTSHYVPFPIVEITWIDTGARMTPAWSTVEDIIAEAEDHDMEVVSVGYLLYGDERHVLLAQSWDKENNGYLNVQQIWAGAILNQKELV